MVAILWQITFCNSVDDSSVIAQTILGKMLLCLYVGSTFLTRLILISKLTSAFLFEQVELTA